MGKTGDMRRRVRANEPVTSVARHAGASDSTAGKYARMVDLSPELPRIRQPASDALDPYKGTAAPCLDDYYRNWCTQRHTAMRAYVRLRDEEGYRSSRSMVQRYVRCRREEMTRKRKP